MTQVLLIFKKRAATPQFPPELHRGGTCSNCARWPTFAPFAPSSWERTQLPATKEWLCQSNGALDRDLWFANHISVLISRRASCTGAWSVSSLFDLLAKDGPRERISRLPFTGVCDNLQQRAMSRRCLSLQQPLRRVSKDPHSFVGLTNAWQATALSFCWKSARLKRSFLQRSPHQETGFIS